MKTGLTRRANQLIEAARLTSMGNHRPYVRIDDVIDAMLLDERGNVAKGALLECGVPRSRNEGSRKAHSEAAAIDIEYITTVAIKEAASLGHGYAGPEHLLLALVGDSFQPGVVEYLSEYNVTPKMLRKEVHAILGTNDPSGC